MSYPDEWEADVERIASELGAAGELPESIRLMNEAAIDDLLSSRYSRSVILEALTEQNDDVDRR
jgi:hypothetical protein